VKKTALLGERKTMYAENHRRHTLRWEEKGRVLKVKSLYYIK